MENRYYNKDIHTVKTAVQAYDLIQAAGGEPSGVAPSSGVAEPSSSKLKFQVRKSFTSRETQRVEAYFHKWITMGKTILKANATAWQTILT